jgi:hypothetical protein
VVAIDPFSLTPAQQQHREYLENKARSAFSVSGLALNELKAKRLYLSTHDRFEDYCLDCFGYTRDSAYLKIGAALIYQNLEQVLPTNGRHVPLPSSERQLRYLVKAKVSKPLQVEIWVEAVEAADGRIPPGRIVREVVQRKTGKPKRKRYRIGEVCRLVTLDNPELKGKGGHWCIVASIDGDLYEVNTWDGEYIIASEHLKSLRYSHSECERMEELGERMSNLDRAGVLDDAAYWILNGLSKLDRPYLSDLEEDLLCFLEQRYLPKS